MLVSYEACGIASESSHWMRQKCLPPAFPRTKVLVSHHPFHSFPTSLYSNILHQLVSTRESGLGAADIIASLPALVRSKLENVEDAYVSSSHVFGSELHAQPAKNNTVRRLGSKENLS